MLKKLLVVLAIIFLAFSVLSCGEEVESEISQSDVSELGQEIAGKQAEFLDQINAVIALKDGINEYDISTSVEVNGNTVSTSSKMVVYQENGAISRFFVKNSAQDFEAYSDLNYVYAEQNGEKVRLDKDAFDMQEYIKDFDEPYKMEDIEYIKTYKKGFVKQYVVGYGENYATNELQELLDELNGAFITDCQGLFVVSENSFIEKVTLEYVYKGKEYKATASRQLKPNSDFEFPDFSEYKAGESVSGALADIETAIEKTQAIKTYTKTLSEFGAQTFSIAVKDGTNKQSSAINSSLGASYNLYYKDGNEYGTWSKYGTVSPYYKKATFEEYYSKAVGKVDGAKLLDCDLVVPESGVDLVMKNTVNGGTQYSFYLNDDGVSAIEDSLDVWLTSVDLVTYCVNGGVITKVELVNSSSGNAAYGVEISSSASLNIPNLSAYRLIIDKDTGKTISAAKQTTIDEWVLGRDAVVDELGNVYVYNSGNLEKYDKNHNLIKSYDIYSSSWHFGEIVGVCGNTVYYNVYDRYYCDISDDNRFYSLDFTTGETRCIDGFYGYQKRVIAYYNGMARYEIYQNTTIGSKVDFETGLTSVSPLYYDIANALLVIEGLENGTTIGVYDMKTGTFRKQKIDGFLNDDQIAGDGYYDRDGVYHAWSQVGVTGNTISYFKVIDTHPDKDYTSDDLGDWQIIKQTDKYTFTTYGVYEKATGNFIYFPRKAEYRFFNGGVHIWNLEVDVLETQKTWVTLSL